MKEKLLYSTLSNYLLLGLRILSMLWLTRAMFLHLSAAQYGFWALLWSVFGYTLLLDFGFGTAVQKWSGQTLADGDWGRLRGLLATLGLCYAGLGALIAAVSLAAAVLLHLYLPHSPELFLQQQVLALFGVGTGLIFPTGMAAELLRGLGQIVLRNLIQGVTLLLQTGLSLWLLQQSPDLKYLTIVTLGCTLMGNLVMLAAALRLLPGGHWKPDAGIVREVAAFSLPAWIITLTNLVIFRSDQIVIGATLGLGAIAGYQIAVRLADLFRQLTTQAHDALGPLAARAYHQNDQALIQRVLIQSNRRVTLLALMLGLPLWLVLPELLTLWLQIQDPLVFLCARLLLLSMIVQVSLRSSSTQILLMCQHERVLMWAALIEAGLNLSLSVLLVKRFGFYGVALGTLLPNLLLALAFNLPLACRVSGLKPADYLAQTLWRPLSAAGLALSLLLPALVGLQQLPLSPWPVARFMLELITCFSVTLLAVFCLGLNPGERTALRHQLQRLNVFRRRSYVLASGKQ